MITHQWIQDKFLEFVNGFPELLENPESKIVDPYDKQATYHKSVKYLFDYSGDFHTSHLVERYIREFLESLDEKQNIIDVGCAIGHTGIKFVEQGHHVTFYDFAGVGLLFLEWLKDDQDYHNMKTLPYGKLDDCRKLEQRFDIVLAFDVLEHVGNHLGFLKWLENLGNKVVLCFPYTVSFLPPYVPTLDEWVDDEVICNTIRDRYADVEFTRLDGRLFAQYST